MFIKSDSAKRITGPIHPVAVTVFDEDGTPYIDYVGTTFINGHKAKIHFPKLGLVFDEMRALTNEEWACDAAGNKLIKWEYGQRLYTLDSRYFEYELLPQEVTLDDLEKMLGYPVIIKEPK